MSQAGFTPILIYGSTTPGATPSASNLTNSAAGVELAMNVADGKLFYKDPGGVVRALSTPDGTVTTAKLADGAVTTAKLADAATTEAKLASNAVTSAKLADNSVTTTKILDANVTTAKLADSAVTTAKLASVSVTSGKISAGAVGSTQLADMAVTSNKIASAAVVAPSIADNAVITSKISDANVTTAKLADASVTTDKIATNAVTNAKIGNAAVSTANIIDASVTTDKIAANAVTNAKIGNAAVSTANIFDFAVTTEKLNDLSVTNAKLSDLSVNAAKLATNSVTTAKWAAANGQIAGFRNKIINGNMEIVQRVASFTTSPGTNGFCQDRWFNTMSASGAGVFITSSSSDAPASAPEFRLSLRATVSTADTSITAGDFYAVQQRIEGYDARDLIGKTFTLSFWVRSSKTGTHCVAFGNNVDRTYVVEYTISAANTWEQKTLTVTGGLTTGGTWNWTNGTGLQVSFALAAGSSFQSPAGSWQAGNYLATANQVNCMDTNGNVFGLTGVQLEVGASATPFEHRPISTELALCQRYYEKSYNLATAPAAAATSSSWVASASATSQYLRVSGGFATPKRAGPTMTVYSPIDGATGFVAVDGVSRVAVISATETAFTFCLNGVTTTANQFMEGHWTASAEL